MSELDEYPDFFVKLNLEFKAIRIVENQMIPTHWKIQSELLYTDTSETDDEVLTNRIDLDIRASISKFRYWLDNIVHNCVIVGADNEWAINSFFDENGHLTLGNNIMILPGPPTDDLIAEVIHSKMNAMGNENIQFGVVELSSDDKNGLSYIFTGMGEFNLPSMEEWIGERAYFDKPWWARDDASTFDTIPNSDDDLSVTPASSFSLDFIKQSLMNQYAVAAQVIRPTFKPTVIVGGAEDDEGIS
jgi:hypothetical protein